MINKAIPSALTIFKNIEVVDTKVVLNGKEPFTAVITLEYKDLSWSIALRRMEYYPDFENVFHSSEEVIEDAKRKFADIIVKEYIGRNEEIKANKFIPSKEDIRKKITLYEDFDINDFKYKYVMAYNDDYLGNTFYVKYWIAKEALEENLYQKSYEKALDELATKVRVLYFKEWLNKNKEESNMSLNNLKIQKLERSQWHTVKDITVYNDRVVKMDFTDGTFTKAVCGEHDEFNFDIGVTICMLKKMLGGQEMGTKMYNKFLNDVHSFVNDKHNAEIAREEEEERIKRKKRKAELKRAAKKLKAKEEQIDIQKQAILRAMDERHRGYEKNAVYEEDDLK